MADSTGQIADIRAFNRFYTRQTGLLEEQFAEGLMTLAEARVLYEIHANGYTTARDLVRSLRIDRGYLSRMLIKFVDLGLTAHSPNPDDKRSNTVALTADGDIVVKRLNQRSDGAVADMVQHLSTSQLDELVSAMRTIRRLLADESLPPRGPVVIRGHRLGDFGWLTHRQGLVYNEQFGWNTDFEALIAGIYSQFHFATETAKDLWVAEQDGSIVGSIFVMASDGLPGSAQLRMLYVEPAARGQGVGAALVAQAVSFARASGYERMRLWTHTNQESARKLYAAAGFQIVETMPEVNFGKELMGEIWELRFQGS